MGKGTWINSGEFLGATHKEAIIHICQHGKRVEWSGPCSELLVSLPDTVATPCIYLLNASVNVLSSLL